MIDPEWRRQMAEINRQALLKGKPPRKPKKPASPGEGEAGATEIQ